MIDKIVVKDVTFHTAETVVFELESGWLRVTTNESTGAVSIESDWGNALARWPTQTGKLKAFLGGIDPTYFERNLEGISFLGGPVKRMAPDWEGAEKMLKDLLIKARRHEETFEETRWHVTTKYTVDKNGAREWWEEIERWCSDSDLDESAALHSVPPAVECLMNGEPWYALESKMTYLYVFWLKHLLPTVIDHFKSATKYIRLQAH